VLSRQFGRSKLVLFWTCWNLFNSSDLLLLLVSFYVNPAKAAKAYQRENKMKRRNKKEIPDEK
jgi:hypothetical protein